MSKRTIVIAVVAVILFVAALFSVMYDFKQPDEMIPDEAEPTFKEKMAAAKAKKASERAEATIQEALREAAEKAAPQAEAYNV